MDMVLPNDTVKSPPYSSGRPTIGLVLSGGGARGLGHILALEAFDEMNIKPDVIAGTSIGAMFGAAYASGLSAKQIKAHMSKVLAKRRQVLRGLIRSRGAPLQNMLRIFQLRGAILKPHATLELVMPKGVAKSFEALSIPLHVVATDFQEQSQVVMSSGDLLRAIAASIAIPSLFSPVRYKETTLVDGGLVNPLPFDVIHDKADIIIAIVVSGGQAPLRHQKPLKAIGTLLRSLQILQNSIVREKLKSLQPDILVELDVGQFHALDFMKLDEILKAAAPAKQELKRKLTRVLEAQTLTVVEETQHGGVNNDLGTHAAYEEAGRETDTDRRRLADRLMGSAG